jgi:hydrophobe/amphiphile efflux-3 (HAE3) family protein
VSALQRMVAASGRHPGRVLGLAGVLVVVGAALALGLSPSAATSTLVGKGSDEYRATERYRERFGDHAIVVLVRGDLPNLLLTANLNRLIGLEGCLSGNAPKGAELPGGTGAPCARLSRSKPVQVVYGPGTFINSAAGEIDDQVQVQMRTKAAEAAKAATAARKLARGRGRTPAQVKRAGEAASQVVYAGFLRDILQLNIKYGLGISRLPSVNDPNFVSALVFDPARGATTPKARFAYLFPSPRSALVQVRLKPDLDEAQRAQAIRDVRAAVGMADWKLDGGGDYVVTGAPVVAEELTNALAGSTLQLLLIGIVVMAIVLALVFRARLRLLPLAVALAAVAIAFGAMALVGAPLTMASIAVLPVLLGLGVDYAIQYQARRQEDGGMAALPTIATAALATAVGFLVLLLSPVPMVRGFGVLLVVGIAVALALALTAGTAVLALAERRRGWAPLASSARGAGELVDAVRTGLGRVLAPLWRVAERVGRAVLRAGMARPGRVLAVGLAVAAIGWGLDSQTEVVSDINRLVPQDLAAVANLGALQRSTGVAGEIDVVIEARAPADLTDPKVVAWMRAYQQGLLKAHGYSADRGCGRADLCPALSLPDLFRTEAAASSRARVRALLDAVPAYFSQAVITADRRTANLAFGVRLMPLDRQQAIVEDMRRRLDPPAGVTAHLAGLQVLGAQANHTLSDPLRRFATLLAGLAAVGLALLAVYRRWERAWVPLAPIALATGWSALVLWALRIPLNPMSATLGALVIAISTEFAVLLSARFREERAAGHAAERALERTYASTGRAVLASGATAIAGFAVLALSDVQMLRDFGLVTVVDLTVSLLGVLAVLPAVLVLAERRAGRRGAGAEPGSAGSARSGRGGGRRRPPAVPA